MDIRTRREGGREGGTRKRRGGREGGGFEQDKAEEEEDGGRWRGTDLEFGTHLTKFIGHLV